jgi:hypothetical protein
VTGGAQTVHHQVEQVARAVFPVGVVEAPQEAHQQQDFVGVDVLADRACLLAGLEQEGDRAGHLAVVLAGQVGAGGRFERIGQAALDPAVGGQAVEPQAKRLVRRMGGQQGRGGGDDGLDILAVHREQQGFAGREVPVHGALADPGQFGDRAERRLPRLGQGRARDRKNPGPVLLGVGTQGRPRGLGLLVLCASRHRLLAGFGGLRSIAKRTCVRYGRS